MKNLSIEFVRLNEEVKNAEKELAKLKAMRDELYQKVITAMGQAGLRNYTVEDKKIYLIVRRLLEVEDMDKTWMHVFNNYPDKLNIDRQEIKKLLEGGRKIPGSKLIEGFYLSVQSVK